jgi:hypothetical protein
MPQPPRTFRLGVFGPALIMAPQQVSGRRENYPHNLENVLEQTANVSDEKFKGIIEGYYVVVPEWQEGDGKPKNMLEKRASRVHPVG